MPPRPVSSALEAATPRLGIALLIVLVIAVVSAQNCYQTFVIASSKLDLPSKPTGLQATTTLGSLDVAVDWDDVEGATEYRVRWRAVGPGNVLNDGVRVSSSNADITVADYGEWVVRVEACNSVGCGEHLAKRFQVEQDPQATPTPAPTPSPTPEPEITVPGQPTGLQATTTAGSLSVALDWDDVEGATEYRVRWRVAEPGNVLNAGVRVASSNSDITVADYGEWVVRVEACNSTGCGEHLAKRFQVEQDPQATPTPTPTPEPTPSPTPEPESSVPDQPTGLQATTTLGSLSVALDWDDVEGATEYRVRWRVAEPGNVLNDGVTG